MTSLDQWPRVSGVRRPYDAMDRVVTMKYPDDEVVTYTYNDQLLLDSMSGSVAGNIASDLAYNALDLPTQVKLSNDGGQNLYLRHRYHVLDSGSSSYPYGALWDIRLERGSGPEQLLRLQHFYDSVRNPTRVIEDGGLDLTYELDDLDRLLKRKITGGADQETFAYAAIGNIATKNGLSFSYSSSHKHAVSNYNGVDYAHDANGNMIGRGTTQTLKFDAENRLVKVSNDSNGYVYIARMAYDGDGRRVKRVDNFGTIHYAGPHYERNVGTGANPTEVVTKFYHAQMGAMKRLIALRRKINGSYEALRYIVPDHLGGILRTVAANGDLVDDIRYHAFGATRSGGTNTPTDKRFTGQTLDASTGLYDYGARSYDGSLGRFCQPDSIVPNPGNPQSLNRYTYCRNNPLKYTDPTGNQEEDPYYVFVGGYGTTNDSNSSDWASMIENLGLKDKPGSYGFFNWESGWSGSGKPSENRPVADAAPELARQIGGQKNVTLIGHSKGGALIMEYLAEIAEGVMISSNSNVKNAFTIDSPLGNSTLTDVVGFQRFTNLAPFGGPAPARDVRDRLGGLRERLAQQGMSVNMATLDNSNDWVGHDPIPGIPHVSISLGDTWSGHNPLGGDPLGTHGLLMNSPIASGYIRGALWGPGW